MDGLEYNRMFTSLYRDVTELLLVNGANIHAENDEALRYAASQGHVEAVELLLENGANIHTYNNYALRRAVELLTKELGERLCTVS